MNNVYLVWLEWAEKCFRVDAEALRYLKGVVPKGSRVVRVRSEAAFLKALPQATHAIVWNFDEAWFAKAPRLKVLATLAAGRELVPAKAPPGVTVHFGHFHGEIIGESVLGFMLCWAKGFFAVARAPKGCRAWPRTWLSERCFDVRGTRAVIVGYGHVGRSIGRRLEQMGVSVVGITRHGVELGVGCRCRCRGRCTNLHFADWLILALPSTTGTDNWLNAKTLAKLPRRCVVINVGRGNAIDEPALVRALKTGRIAGAYLDVCQCEKSQVWAKRARKKSAGLIDPANPKVPNLVLMPHSSAFSQRYVKLGLEELKNDGML